MNASSRVSNSGTDNPNQVVVTEKTGINSLAEVKDKYFPVAAAGSSVEGECKNHFTTARLAFPDDIITKLQADYPWYAAYTIKADTYPNQDADVQTTAIKMVMFCSADLDEQTVYDLPRTLWKILMRLANRRATSSV
ncbi:MAG: bcsP [Oscillospiraceae bacterium]|nr:bcsP [Oscillospiraceae bacterium]